MAIRIVAVIFFLAGELLCVMTILPPLIDVSGVVWTGLVAIAIFLCTFAVLLWPEAAPKSQKTRRERNQTHSAESDWRLVLKGLGRTVGGSDPQR